MSDDAAQSPDSIEALSNAVNHLRAERDGLRQAMRHRAVIEQAKGMLAERLTVSPDQAFGKLVELSSRSNVKVAELAAALVARQVPDSPQTPEYLVPDAAAEAKPEPVPESSVTAAVGSVQVALQLLNSQIGTVSSFDNLAHTIASATECWPRPENVLILVPEADGALRLTGSAGMSTSTRSQWERIPPIEELPIVSAMVNRAAVMLSDADAVQRQFPVVADHPHEALIAVPLIHEDRLAGVLELTWSEALTDAEAMLSRLYAITDACARRCEKLVATLHSTDTDVVHTVEPATLALFMEALSEPAVLMSPVWSDDHIVDFHIELASAPARDAARTEQINKTGGTLLTTLPRVGSHVLLPALVQAMNSGEPQQLSNVFIDGDLEATDLDYRVDLHAVRLWDRVLLTWRFIPDSERMWPQFRFLEKTLCSGSVCFDTEDETAVWSPGARALFALSAEDSPPTADALAHMWHADDVGELTAAAAAAEPGEAVSANVRGAGPYGGREFAVTMCTDPAQPARITMVIRDARATGSVMSEHNKVAAAAERVKLVDASERIEQLTRSAADDNIDQITCQVVSPVDAACWVDRVKLSDGSLLLVVGEVIEGEPEAHRQQLRHAAVAYAIAGMEPHEILSHLNDMCCRTGSAAAVSVASLDAKENLLRWATAGQNVPIVVDPSGKARLQTGTTSLTLGATPDIEHHVNTVELPSDSRVVLYSESLLTSPNGRLPHTLAALLETASHHDVQEAATRLHADLGGDFDLCLVAADIAS